MGVQPDATDIYDGTTPVTSIWPGAGYVDVLGLDGYNWGTGGVFAWRSFGAIYAIQYARLVALAPTLPVWVCETGSKEPTENDGAPIDPAHSKAAWVPRPRQLAAPDARARGRAVRPAQGTRLAHRLGSGRAQLPRRRSGGGAANARDHRPGSDLGQRDRPHRLDGDDDLPRHRPGPRRLRRSLGHGLRSGHGPEWCGARPPR